VTDSQLFAFNGAAGPQALTPQNGKNAVCLTVKGTVIDQVACNGAASASGAEVRLLPISDAHLWFIPPF
jgi:hypothetical protein